MLLNPYVVVFTARTSVTLLGYAALPWLLLVRAPRAARAAPWWWPAAFALIVTASGRRRERGGDGLGAARAAAAGARTSCWIGAACVARGCGRSRWRAALATALASAWWVVPLLVQSRYGVDFLRFTEQPGTIWSTTSLPESLRLMGYWISYLGVGYGGTLRPYFGDGGVLLFALPVVLAGLLVPALALAGLRAGRGGCRYAPFCLLLVLVGLLVMTAGFPEGTPLRRASNFTYNHFIAGPVPAHDLQGGAAASRSGVALPGAASRRCAARGARARRRARAGARRRAGR